VARIRSIKPELRTSLTAAEWPREVRYFWTLLWGYLDDHGRGVDNNRLILADCFPLDRDLDEHIIDSWLDMFTMPGAGNDCGPLCRYEVKGKHYLHATNWREHQKPSHPTDSRIPQCPLHEAPSGTNGQVNEASGTSPEALAKTPRPTPETFVPEQLIGDVVRDVDGEVVVESTEPLPGFGEFWNHWPRKVSKPDARKAWDKAISKNRGDPAAIVKAAVSYAERCRLVGQDPKFIPHPATWLNRESWGDDLDAVLPLPNQRSPSKHEAFQNSTDPHAYDGEF